jgi:hypothetical protein
VSLKQLAIISLWLLITYILVLNIERFLMNSVGIWGQIVHIGLILRCNYISLNASDVLLRLLLELVFLLSLVMDWKYNV